MAENIKTMSTTALINKNEELRIQSEEIEKAMREGITEDPQGNSLARQLQDIQSQLRTAGQTLHKRGLKSY